MLNDDGLPEAVAQLVFMGSEEYPYVNLLNRWSHKCFSRDPKAHTFQDYTCYSMKTSESKGFFSLLPVYLDHIFYPTLTVKFSLILYLYYNDIDRKSVV